MKVLVACEESQAVTIELRKQGHEAYSCDIQPCSGGHPEWHIMGDVSHCVNGRCLFGTQDDTIHEIDTKWDMIIAHPPCTYMSNAGACRMYPRKGQIDEERLAKAMKAKEFFMMFYNMESFTERKRVPSTEVRLSLDGQRLWRNSGVCVCEVS